MNTSPPSVRKADQKHTTFSSILLGGLLLGACGAPGGPLVVDDPCWKSVAGESPVDLRCTGLYEDWAEKRLAVSARPFTPGTILWSDGAKKQRWIYLPEGTTIDTSVPDQWVFPVGTKTWKEFVKADRRVETRMFEKMPNGKWSHATYLWSADESSAPRNDLGVGNWEGTGYSVPASGDCDKCHAGRTDRVLGFEAVALAQPTSAGLTLDVLNQEGRLAPVVDPSTARLPANVPAPSQAAAQWLHVNCGTSCHNRNPSATANGTGLFMRIELNQIPRVAALGNTAFDSVATTVGKPGLAARWSGSNRVKPGAPDMSLLFRLATSRGVDQMPPILSHIPDPDGTRILREWISSLNPDGTAITPGIDQ